MPDSLDNSNESTNFSIGTLFGLAILLCLLVGAGFWFFRPMSGHDRMLDLLEKIKQETSVKNSYLGDAKLRSDLIRFESLTAPIDRFELNWEIAKELLRMGRNDESIERFDEYAETIKAGTARFLTPEEEANYLFDAATAHFRRGETDNCVCSTTGDSCLLPIRGGGVHTDQRGSKKAIEYLNQVLEIEPTEHRAIWLLNVAHMTLGTYPEGVPSQFLIATEKFQSDIEFPRFLNAAPGLGLATLNLSGGTIVDDFDNDGLLDLVSSTWDTAGEIHFFRNQGNGAFADRTEEAGLKGLWGGLNLVQADYDNDGDLDVLVLRGSWLQDAGKHPNSLLQNDGKGHFRDVTFEAGLGDSHHPTSSASWADYDLDGDLDLYVGNEADACQLFQNQGDGTFKNVAAMARVVNLRYTKGVIWGDFDNDRYPDLYVSNLKSDNRLYRNKGDGTFEDVALKLNVAEPKLGFAVWFWDFNNDGNLDLFASSYDQGVVLVADDYLNQTSDVERDRLYQGDGKGGFAEVAVAKGLGSVTQPMGCNFGDLNNDGFSDFYLGTGTPNYAAVMPNLMFLNQGGDSFADVSSAGGFSHLQKGHGVAFADMDNDGDQDVFIQMGGAYPGDAFGNVLFQNPGFDNNSIVIELQGITSNRFAVGCRICCKITEDGKKREVFKWVNSGGSFGANPLRQEIGLGKAEEIEVLEVFWPTTGKTQSFKDVSVNQRIRIVEGQATLESLNWDSIDFSAGK